MDMNPQRVRTAEFTTVKRGLDPDQVKSFLGSVADELERAQNQSTAMEARARAAVARLQELSSDVASQSDASAETTGPTISGGNRTTSAAEPSIEVTVDQSETISRTLLLAQRTADTAIAEARAEAQHLRDEAEAEIAGAVESSRAASQVLLAEARAEARKAGDQEKIELAGEVNSLMARRDFLESDVDHMEQFLVAQRSRLRDAANEIVELTERVPSGLGESHRPLLSAATEGTLETGPAAADDDLATAIASQQQANEPDDPAMAPADEDNPGSGPIMKFGFDNGFENGFDNDND